MGFDESNNKTNYQSNQELINLAKQTTNNDLDSILKKIENICFFDSKPSEHLSIRMEVCEILGKLFLI